MKTVIATAALFLVAAALAPALILRAQEDPPAPDKPDIAGPGIAEPDIAEPEMAPEPDAPAARPFRLSRLTGEPLRKTLDFDRWLEMSFRERQTFVEGAVLTLSSIAGELRGDLAIDGRVPPENLNAVVKFVRDHYPKLPPMDYMNEMDRIYLTAEGQNLSMMECFQLAFRRLNSR